jgi:hypothetical protein
VVLQTRPMRPSLPDAALSRSDRFPPIQLDENTPPRPLPGTATTD